MDELQQRQRARREALRRLDALERRRAKLAAELVEVDQAIASSSELLLRDAANTARHDDMPSPAPPVRVRMAAARSRSKHQAVKAFYARGETIGQVAAKRGIPRVTLQAWIDGRNPIPSAQADYFQAEYDVPRSAWAKIY